jgi:hypothetical protein
MIENLIVSLYIAVIALYFRHSVYHVIAVYSIAVFLLVDFTDSDAVLYSLVPSILVCVFFLLGDASKKHRRKKHRTARSMGAGLLRPFVFLLPVYHVFNVNVDVPLGAISVSVLSDFIYVAFVWFDPKFSERFKHIRHIYITFALTIILIHHLYFAAAAFIFYYAVTHLLPIGYLKFTT